MIKFFLTRDVAAPERENGNAGFDFFVPRFNEAFKLTCEKEAEKISAFAFSSPIIWNIKVKI